ncbi:MAG TPA: GYD domain-containing protein [Gemmatimonadota bacterium]|nr:GYD domain-containing protein [Gemmatimonadota bacterium]
MPTYIQLINWTQDGIKAVKKSPERLDQARALVKKAGGSLDEFYLTLGRYDMVIVSEAPDDAAVARSTLQLAMGGAIRSETLRAFTEEEYRKIIAAL